MDHSDCDLRFLSDGTIWDDSCDRVVEDAEISSYKYACVEVTLGGFVPEPVTIFGGE